MTEDRLSLVEEMDQVRRMLTNRYLAAGGATPSVLVLSQQLDDLVVRYQRAAVAAGAEAQTA